MHVLFLILSLSHFSPAAETSDIIFTTLRFLLPHHSYNKQGHLKRRFTTCLILLPFARTQISANRLLPTMADAAAEGVAKLQLDEETGEMVSKGELKKRLAKRAKKANKEANKAQQVKEPAAAKKESATKPKTEETPSDPDSMFKEGFLAKVYSERPTGKDTVTRFPPEPNGL